MNIGLEKPPFQVIALFSFLKYLTQCHNFITSISQSELGQKAEAREEEGAQPTVIQRRKINF